MKIFKKIVKMIALIFIGLIVVIFTGGYLFIKFRPDFGARPTAEQKLAYAKTGHYENGKFLNYVFKKDLLQCGRVFVFA